MEKSIVILHGTIMYSEDSENIYISEDSYIISENGFVEGIYKKIPEKYRGLEYIDYRDSLIIPGMTDLHLHAPQYSFRGLGMDSELLEWLNRNTFPEEAKYEDLSYATEAYRIFVDNLKKSSTTRACIFATIHKEATITLMDLLEKSGLCCFVGKVNMDRNSPEYLTEYSADYSVEETEKWLKMSLDKAYQNTFPIITPRFIPSCSDVLMEKLHHLCIKYNLPVQSHLSENVSEIEWVQELCPWSTCYADAYDRFGMFGSECKTIMAHCVHSSEEEIELMKKNGVYVAHCPESNINLSSGIAPIKRYMKYGLNIGLGSDIAAGSTENLFTAMACSIKASKMRNALLDSAWKPLTVENVFYLATKGGGSFFGKVGSFEKGYEFDAVILNDSRLKHPQKLDAKNRLERMLYLADDREVVGKYVKGKKLF